jgi:uncharacterized membrane protein
MRSRLSMLGGHPVHVMVVPFAMVPFALAVVFDLLVLAGVSIPATVTLATALFGLAATGAAISTGLLDLAAIPDEVPAHATAAYHFVGGLVILGLYGLVAGMVHYGSWVPGDTAILAANLAGSAAVGVQGWLGGELVVKHRMGVLEDDEGADPVDLS